VQRREPHFISHSYWSGCYSDLSSLNVSGFGNQVHFTIVYKSVFNLTWCGINKKPRSKEDESSQARVCIRVFSTLMPRSNENKSCTRVIDESWEARVCMRVCMRVFSTLTVWSNENKSYMRVETRARVATFIKSRPRLSKAYCMWWKEWSERSIEFILFCVRGTLNSNLPWSRVFQSH
jgi:hypothetical protein